MDTMLLRERAGGVRVGVDRIWIRNARIRLGVAEHGVVVQRRSARARQREVVVGRDDAAQRVADTVTVLPLELRVSQPRHHSFAEIGFELGLDKPPIAVGGVSAWPDVVDEALLAPVFRATEQES